LSRVRIRVPIFQFIVFNLGSGKGVSVLEMVKFMEIASGKPVPIEVI
jgi:UDP-glucose 4-epimerase